MRNFKLLVAVIGLLMASSVSATYIQAVHALGINDHFYPGTTASIEISPTLPSEGEGFKVTISGTWMAEFIPTLEDFHIEIRPSTNHISFNAQPDYGEDFVYDPRHENTWKGEIEELAEYEYTFSIGPEFVDQIDLDKPISVSFSLRVYPYYYQRWKRHFDLKWGLHEIPPRLGSGYWISNEKPYEGLMIEQQGDVVVFYEMTYNSDDGRPKWIYADGRFQGDSTNSKAYLPIRNVPDKIYEPVEDGVSFRQGSGSIRVLGFNRVQSVVATNSYDEDWEVLKWAPENATYKRWHFGKTTYQLPPTVPDFSGNWNFYEFDGRTLLSSDAIEFLGGTLTAPNTYQFLSTDQAWQLECVVPLSGEGACELKGDMVIFSFDFDSFNGNVATGLITDLSNGATNPDGVLLREGYTLPVLAE